MQRKISRTSRRSRISYPNVEEAFTDVEPKFSDVQVNGKPAVRVELEGTEPSGVKVGYLITVVEADKMYISIVGTGNASAFAKQKQLLSDLPNQLKVTGQRNAPAATPPSRRSGANTAAPAPAQAPVTDW